MVSVRSGRKLMLTNSPKRRWLPHLFHGGGCGLMCLLIKWTAYIVVIVAENAQASGSCTSNIYSCNTTQDESQAAGRYFLEKCLCRLRFCWRIIGTLTRVWSGICFASLYDRMGKGAFLPQLVLFTTLLLCLAVCVVVLCCVLSLVIADFQDSHSFESLCSEGW